MTRTGSQSKAASQPAVGDGPEARRIALAFLAIAGGIYALTTLTIFSRRCSMSMPSSSARRRSPLQLENHDTYVRKGLAWAAGPEGQDP